MNFLNKICAMIHGQLQKKQQTTNRRPAREKARQAKNLRQHNYCNTHVVTKFRIPWGVGKLVISQPQYPHYIDNKMRHPLSSAKP